MIEKYIGGKEWTSARAGQKEKHCAVGYPSGSSLPFVQIAYHHNEGSKINCCDVGHFLLPYTQHRKDRAATDRLISGVFMCHCATGTTKQAQQVSPSRRLCFEVG